MATQGLVTVKKDGRVAMKFITGSDGMEARRLAKAIRAAGCPLSPSEGYDMALKLGFGSDDSLVVMDAERAEFRGRGGLSPRYRATFDQAGFNPRWALGTADYVEVIEL